MATLQASGAEASVSGVAGCCSPAAAHGLPAAIVLGCLELGIGLGVLAPRGRRVALGTGIAVSVLMWILVQDFGGLFTGTATDPNAAPLYVLLAAALYRFTTAEASAEDDVTRVATRPGG